MIKQKMLLKARKKKEEAQLYPNIIIVSKPNYEGFT